MKTVTLDVRTPADSMGDFVEAMRLTEAAQAVMHVRDARAFWEPEFKRSASLRMRYPQGYEQMLRDSFTEYKSLGGTAAKVEEVRPVAPPCTHPRESYRRPGVPLRDSRQIPVAPR